MDIHEARRKIREVVDDASPVESPTAYYALFHPAGKSTLFVQEDSRGRVVGFVGRFQTGADLFRPLVTLHCTSPQVANTLLQQALVPGRPYIFSPASSNSRWLGIAWRSASSASCAFTPWTPRAFAPR
ncbi:MAG: hypothetical protein HC915_11130 [Anaerolineae bacterium]|nr:hypothetical protein [Anaerolineae bacterium]